VASSSPHRPDRSRNRYLDAERLQELYGRGSGPVAFLDEAYRPKQPNGERPFYLLSAALVERGDLSKVRDSLMPFADERGRYHTTELYKQEPGKIHEFLNHVNGLPLDNLVTVQTMVRDGNLEQARDECLTRMAYELNRGSESVQHLIMESLNSDTDPGRNHKDQQVIHRAARGGLIPSEVSIHHSTPSHEQLLWIPDAVAWAVRRELAVGDTRWVQDAETIRIVHAIGQDLTPQLAGKRALNGRSPHLPQPSPGAQSLFGSSEKIGADRVSSVPILSRSDLTSNSASDRSVTVLAINDSLRSYRPTAEDRIVDGFGKGNEIPIANGVQQYTQEQSAEGSRPNKRMELLINRISNSKAFSETSASVMEGLLERLQGERKAVEAQADSPVKPVREDPPRPESPGPTIQ
jgi:hypothetical protein